MMKRSAITLALGAILLLLAAIPTQAQFGPRSNSGFFTSLKAGAAFYRGDLNDPNQNFIEGFLEDADIYAGLELGYRFSPRFSLHLQAHRSNYNDLERNPSSDLTTRYGAIAHLQYNILPNNAITPYVLGGIAVTQGFGGTSNYLPGDSELSFGPGAGLGFDWALGTGRTALYIEGAGYRQAPDVILDNFQNFNTPSSDNDADWIGYAAIGYRYFFKPVNIPVDVTGINCPGDLLTDQAGTFTAMVNDDASTPLSYMWDWGDGTTSDGMTATHSFARPGTYTVTFTASGPANSDTEVCTVTVESPVEAPIVASINARPNPAMVNQTVTFTSNVRGTPPFTYRWDFGDGATASTANATHAYAAPGTYTVRFTVTNSAGSDTETLTMVVNAPAPTPCEDLITELGTVYFNFGSADLDADAQSRLRENIELISECPTICVQINAYADHAERNPQRLSERRAESVREFYIANGIAASRLMARGLGRAPVPCLKEDPGRGCRNNRRAESIPMDCDDM